MTRTDKVVAGLAVAALLYEGYTLINKSKGDTISEAVWNVTAKRPLVPFALGMLCGHWFWQRAQPDTPYPYLGV